MADKTVRVLAIAIMVISACVLVWLIGQLY